MTVEKLTLNLTKFLKSIKLSENEVFKALNIPQDVRWMRDMDNCKNLASSWRVYDMARNHLGPEGLELINKLAELHEKKSQEALNLCKDTQSIFQVMTYSLVDNPAYTKGAEILKRRLHNHSSLARLHSELTRSKNQELVQGVRRKLSLACGRAISKRLSLFKLAELRLSARNLTELNVGAKKINERYSKRLKKFLAKPRTVAELRTARRYARAGVEFSAIDNEISLQVLKECKEGKSFLRSSRMLIDSWNMLSKDTSKLECMSALANRAKTFGELLSVFEKHTDGAFANDLKTKIFIALIDKADTTKKLLYLYKMKFLEEISSDEYKKKIIIKLATLHLE